MHPEFIRDIRILHRLKDSAGGGMPADLQQQLQRAGLFIDTCQRQLSISHANFAPPGGFAYDPAATWLRGRAAYALLLQTITGLNSSLQGETNVQGQFRRQWQAWQTHADPALAGPINLAMRALLEDSRLIRSQYLQGIGGHSYGSLVRKLLAAPPTARIVFIGSGELAVSMLDLFAEWQTGLWNRHEIIPQAGYAGRIFAPPEQPAAAGWATHLVFTTPPDNDHDEQWQKLLSKDVIRIIHLGRRRADRGPWHRWLLQQGAAPDFRDLDDVIELQQRQSTLRSIRLLQARYACAIRANERMVCLPPAAREALTVAVSQA